MNKSALEPIVADVGMAEVVGALVEIAARKAESYADVDLSRAWRRVSVDLAGAWHRLEALK